MATLALGAAGQATGTAFGGPVGGAIGGFVGGTVGAFIDQQFLGPFLFGKQTPIGGQRLDDLPFQGASPGAPVNYMLGSECRVNGTVIWMAPRTERKKKQSVGGKGTSGASATQYLYSRSAAVAFGESSHEIKQILANGKVIWDRGDEDKRYASISIYNGSETQTPDALIESYEGAGEVPAYRGLTYCVIEELQLADFGNVFPRLTAIIEADNGISVEAGIEKLLLRNGYDADDITVDIECECLRALVLQGPQSGSDQLQALLLAYNLVLADRNGKVAVLSRDRTQTHTVPASDLAASSGGIEPNIPLRVRDASDIDPPSSVAVRYIDRGLDYQYSEQLASRPGAPANVQQYELPLVLSPQDANAIARRLLYAQYTERRSVELTLPPQYMHVLPGDVLSIPINGRTYAARVSRINRTRDLLLSVEAIVETDNINSLVGDARDDANTSNAGVYTPPELTSIFADAPALRIDDLPTPGIYHTAATSLVDASYRGASLYTSAGTAFGLADDVPAEGDLGVCVTLLGVASEYLIDSGEFEVKMTNGELSSRTQAEMLAGEGRLLVGKPGRWELIGYTTATLTGVRRYRLSGLLRGLRGTEKNINMHEADDFVLSLDGGGISRLTLSTATLGTTLNAKHVPADGVVSAYAATPLSITGQALKPFSPVQVRGSRDASNNLTITWNRRTREFVRLLALSGVPLGEEIESYEVDIVHASSVVRTLSVTSPSASYSAADQSTDGLTPGDPVTVRVYQKSAIAGRGAAREETV